MKVSSNLVMRLTLALLLLTSCSSHMIQTDLYFAQSRPDGTLIDKADWDRFNETEIKSVFKNGSTIVNATGTWNDPVTHKLISEPTHVVTYYYKRSPDISKQIDSLIISYKNKFQQQSVLRVDRKVKVRF